MARRREGDRVLGPYKERDKWRIVIAEEGGERLSHFFATEGEASAAIRIARRDLERIAGITVKEALEKYEIHQREEKRDKIQSVLDTIYRLGLLFTDGDALLSGLTPTRCGLLLSNLKQRNTKYGKPFAVDSLKNILAESKTFMNWCVESQGWLKSNPLMKLQVEGKRRHRKFQLHYDEARRWMDRALELAEAGDVGAVAALVALFMGFRATEIVIRVVRDLDDRGRILVVEDAKTEAGNRRVKVPPVLRPFLKQLAQGKGPDDRLFGHHWRDWVRKSVRRICREVGVPEVSAQSLRGLNASIRMEESSESPTDIARALGHSSASTTLQSYATRESAAAGRQNRVTAMLLQGRDRGPIRRNIVPQSFRTKKNAALRRRIP
jgi:integrase